MWLHVPSMCCPSAPESADSISACEWRSQLLAQSVTSRGKLMLARSWLNAWRKGGWKRRLFGRISKPSTASRGVRLWIASLAVTRASRSARLASDSEKTTHATSGPTSGESLQRSSRESASSKTSPAIYRLDSRRSYPTWKLWVTELRRACSQRRKLGPHIGESGFSSWATPAVFDTSLGVMIRRKANKIDRLQMQAAAWGNDSQVLRKCPGQINPQPGVNSSGASQDLNPQFVEMLMGWPIGWTASEPSATASSRKPRHSRGKRLKTA